MKKFLSQQTTKDVGLLKLEKTGMIYRAHDGIEKHLVTNGKIEGKVQEDTRE